MTVRVGVLGCGGIARSAHVPSLMRIAGARVVAIADPDAARLAAVRALATDARPVADYHDVLAMPDVDAVIVALPPALHADAALAALTHGKHVYVEKPLAATVADGARVVTAAEGSALTAMMGFNYRYNPIVQDARARIAGGAIGALIGVRTVFATSVRTLAPWKHRRELGGGVLLDLAVHHIDLIHFLLDAHVVDVSADIRSVRTEHDTAFLHLRLTGDCSATSMFSLSGVEEDRIEVYGTNGKVTIDRYASLRAEVSAPAARGAFGHAASRLIGELRELPYALRKQRAPMHDPSFPAAMQAFVQAVHQRTPASPSLRDGLRTLEVIDAAESSARSGRVVALRPATAAIPQSIIDGAGV